jgi:hypothetical protein
VFLLLEALHGDVCIYRHSTNCTKRVEINIEKQEEEEKKQERGRKEKLR